MLPVWLHLKKGKCVFMADSVIYLGYRKDADGLYPVPKNLKAVQRGPKPCNVSELKSYLEFLTYIMTSFCLTWQPLLLPCTDC